MTTGYSRVDDEAQKFERLSPSETAIRTTDPNGVYYDAIDGGVATLSVSGTAQQITAVTGKGAIAIRANDSNTGRIWIGDSSVDNATQNGIFMDGNDFYSLSVDDLSKVYFDGSNAGDKIHYNITYVTP